MSAESPHAVAIAQPIPLVELACKPQDVLRAAALIQEVMASVMKDGEHYGVIPGTDGKKSLYKSGAEKLCFTFGLANKLDITVDNMAGGHREYRIICHLFDRLGNPRGQGVGSCSTLETKYRYRGAAGHTCPKCSAQAVVRGKADYGGGWYCNSKKGGCGASFKGNTAEAKTMDKLPVVRAENPDPADQYNTVLKMAKKRALVDAVLTATGASDCFAQDLEDLEGEIDAADARDAAKPAAAQAARTAPAAQQSEPAKDAKPAPAELVRARTLWTELEKQAKGRGSQVLDRLCALHGAKAPKDIAPAKLEQFGKDVDELAKDLGAERIDDLLGQWEHAAKEEQS